MTRKLLGGALLAALGTMTLFAQPRMKGGKNAATERNIQKLETILWHAFKDHNAKPFEEHLTADSINMVNPVSRGKATIVKDITSDNCKVSSFSLSGFAYQWLDANSVIVIYEATEDGICGGEKLPAKVNASTVWVKRDGKWLAAFHQESPAM